MQSFISSCCTNLSRLATVAYGAIPFFLLGYLAIADRNELIKQGQRDASCQICHTGNIYNCTDETAAPNLGDLVTIFVEAITLFTLACGAKFKEIDTVKAINEGAGKKAAKPLGLSLLCLLASTAVIYAAGAAYRYISSEAYQATACSDLKSNKTSCQPLDCESKSTYAYSYLGWAALTQLPLAAFMAFSHHTAMKYVAPYRQFIDTFFKSTASPTDGPSKHLLSESKTQKLRP